MAGLAAAAEQVVTVEGDAALRAALGKAQPGMRIRIQPGRYQAGVYAANLRGTPEAPIVVEGADPQNPPVFEGGGEGWHLGDCQYLTLRNLAVGRQSSNGINVDDGGTFDTPAHHVVLEGLRVYDVGPKGNHDGIKLSGLDDFVVRDCTVEGWGGQAIDMVGCHRGLIEGCTFRGKQGFTQDTGPQTKGGSRDVTIRRCQFFGEIGRGVNVGGSTGLSVFRPQGALYEAKEICVDGCLFVGGQAPVAFVGVDGAIFRYNTIYRPTRWVLRILQETTERGFAACRDGRFERNLVVFRRGDLQTAANVGPNTRPETFTFADNWWYCEDRPASSKPQLPAAETGGVYGADPRLTDAARRDFRPRDSEATQYGFLALPKSAGRE
jgi:hypothetical protein